jgi:hypothetical protein
MGLSSWFVPRRFRDIVACGFLAVLLLLTPSLAASTVPAEVTIEGTIQFSGIQRLQDARIGIPILKLERKISTGPFRIKIPNPGRTHFQCEVWASGFKKSKLTVVVSDHTASLGIVRLQPYIELLSMTVTPTEEATTRVDFVIENKLSSPLIIQRLELSAPTLLSGVEGGPCFTEPMLILHFRSNAVATQTLTPGRLLKLKLDVNPKTAGGSAERGLIVAGEILVSCGVSPRILLTAPYPFSVNPHDQRKIRLEVPQSLKVSWSDSIDDSTVGDLTPDWRHAMAGVYLRGGDQIVVEPD